MTLRSLGNDTRMPFGSVWTTGLMLAIIKCNTSPYWTFSESYKEPPERPTEKVDAWNHGKTFIHHYASLEISSTVSLKYADAYSTFH